MKIQITKRHNENKVRMSHALVYVLVSEYGDEVGPIYSSADLLLQMKYIAREVYDQTGEIVEYVF